MIRRALRKIGRAPEWLYGRLANRGAILTYHRVGKLGPDPYGIAVSEKHFREHLEILAKRATPLSLAQMHEAIAAKRIPRGAVAVTLDDGYRDALTIAKPLLVRHAVPATAFIVTGQTGNARGFWWDELHRVIMEPAALPGKLALSIDGKIHRWRLLEDSEPASRYGMNRIRGEKRVGRELLFWQVYNLLLPLTEEGWLQAQDQLLAWVGMKGECPAADCAMTASEILALADGGLVEIGAHTQTHPQLTCLAPSGQLREVRRSRERLEEITGRTVSSFAYPHGSFDARSVAATREAGFRRACTTIPDRVTPIADAMRLPRIDVPDCDGEAFARSLRWLLD